MVDLSACEREPIHIPGAIQPHGVLLALSEPELTVQVHSANAAAFFGLSTAPAGRRIHELLPASATAALESAAGGDPSDGNPLEIVLASGRRATGVAHRAGGLLILEIEPAEAEPASLAAAHRRLVGQFERLRRTRTLEEVSDLAAREIRRIIGFDRVMVYRFDTEANGEVIAEDRSDASVESYLGLHYPASDIPAQARRLYVDNPIRIIVDADYSPVPLVPELNPLSGAPLDLSHSVLRSVSPVHCQYLANMGVRASMSISLIKDEQLWGLVACHHRAPLHVPYATRLTAEILASVLSAHIAEIENQQAHQGRTQAHAIQAQIVDQMLAAPRWQDALAGSAGHTLKDLLRCDGAAIVYQGEVTRIGDAPPVTFVRELAASLSDQNLTTVTATDQLCALFPPTRQHLDCAAGLLAVPLAVSGTDMMLWFRREQLRDVTWAGDPAKPAIASDDGRHIGPRRSFAAWKQRVRERSEPWLEWEIEVAAELRTALIASVMHQAAELARMNRKLVDQRQQRDRFLAAVSHELRNPINAILGWTQVARSEAGAGILDRALDTIERNARIQAQLIGDLLDASRIHHGKLRLALEPFHLADTVRDAVDTIQPFAREKHIRIDVVVAEDIELHGDPSRVQQVVWNLLSNAVRYSGQNSRVAVEVRRDATHAIVEVADQGEGISPTLLGSLFEPFQQGDGASQSGGLGIGLSIARSIVELHAGAISVHSAGPGTGATFTVRLPLARPHAPGSQASKVARPPR